MSKEEICEYLKNNLSLKINEIYSYDYKSKTVTVDLCLTELHGNKSEVISSVYFDVLTDFIGC